jgi:CRISPR-associated protein Csb3
MTEAIRIPVDAANPGQFFACCGLLELASRLWPGATAAFEPETFVVRAPIASPALSVLLQAFKQSPLLSTEGAGAEADDDESESELASPMSLGSPFHLTLNWWSDRALKPWAGSMNAGLIFAAMRDSIDPDCADPLNDLRVVRDPPDPAAPTQKTKKREPFYFDARRGSNAKSIDVGFAPDALGMTSAACPAVEALCIIGLQRFKPMPTDQPRVFVYRAWATPLPSSVAAAAVSDLLPGVGGERYRFENAFRTDQRKHKGFLPATRMTEGDDR